MNVYLPLSRAVHRLSRSVHRRERSGYTLMEILLVLGLLVMVLAVAWPSIMKMRSDYQIRQGAELVRKELARARVRSMEYGTPYAFYYEPKGTRFVIIPAEGQGEGGAKSGGGSTSGYESAGSGAENVKTIWRVAGTLPRGMVFVSITKANESRVKLSRRRLSGLESLMDLEGVDWAGPSLFFPDGSSETLSVDVVDENLRRGREISVRSLTGLTQTGDSSADYSK